MTTGPTQGDAPFSPDGTRILYLSGLAQVFKPPSAGLRRLIESGRPFSVSSRGGNRLRAASNRLGSWSAAHCADYRRRP